MDTFALDRRDTWRTSRPLGVRPTFPAPPLRWRLCLLLVASVACGTEPVVWQGAAAGDAERPSPMSYPAPQPFDKTLSDTGAISEFARTQDLLREAGALSMLASVLDAMPESREAAAIERTSMPSMAHDPMGGMGATGAIGNDLGHGSAPVDSARCGRSLRTLEVPGLGRVAVWWSRRSRGRVALMASWQFGTAADSMASWRGPTAVDTLDQGPSDANAAEHGAAGCDRPAPGLAVDARAYVHVSYALNAPEGPGVFYAHQMDPRSPFEPPQAIVYGEQLGETRVAARGDVVAIVYEDPNSQSRTQIGLALSSTSGHLFGDRRTVSSSSSVARDPYVAVQGRALVVGWSDMPSSSADLPTFRVRRALLR